MVQYYKALSLKAKTMLILVLALIIAVSANLIATATVASSGVFSGQTPPDGSVISSTKPVISVDINDRANDPANTGTPVITTNNVTMTLDDTQVSATLTGTSPNFKLSYTPASDLVEGLHKVIVTAYTNSGEPVQTSWSFTVNKSAPVLSNQSPAGGTKLSSLSKIAFTAKDSDEIDSALIQANVNGNPATVTSVIFPSYGHWETDSCGNTIWVIDGYDYTKADVELAYTGSIKDINAIRVNVSDKLGNQVVDQWTVYGTEAPQITEVAPVSNAVLHTIQPDISAKISDNEGIAEVVLQLDGSRVPHQYTASSSLAGTVSYKPDKNLTLGKHNVTLVIKDLAGNSVSKSWAFDLQVFATQKTNTASLISVGMHDVAYGTPFTTKLLDTQAATMLLDGVKVDAMVSGTSPDYTLSYAPEQYLSGGSHTVVTSVYDQSGELIKTSWSFTLNQPPPVSATNVSPAPDSRVPTSTTKIIAKVGTAELSSYQILLDGNPLPTTFYPAVYDTCTFALVSEAYITADIPVGTSVGLHNVTSITDGYAREWKFYYDNIPVIDATPAKNVSISTRSPEINITVNDDSPITKANLVLTIDGQVVDFSCAENGNSATLKYTPAVPFTDEATHQVKLVVTDVSGPTEHSWFYYVNTFGGTLNFNWDTIDLKQTCRVCHNQQGAMVETNRGIDYFNNPTAATVDYVKAHKIQYNPDTYPTQNCTNCHTSTDGGGSIGTHMGCSGSCHGSGTYYDVHEYAGRRCLDCHVNRIQYIEYNDYRDVDGEQPPEEFRNSVRDGHDFGYKHIIRMDFSSCNQCHSQYLWREHERHTNLEGAKLNCDTCHKSNDIKVVNAIKNQNTDCAACHQADHNSLHGSTMDDKCGTCHQGNLTTEHLNNTKTQSKVLDCSSCHNSAEQKVKNALNTDNTQCAACHTSGHNIGFAETVPTDIPLYTGLKWTTPMDLEIFAGEPWVPADMLEGGKVLISNRSNSITSDSVYGFYSTAMAENGWTLVTDAPEAGVNKFTIVYTKGIRKVVLYYYSGPVPGDSTEVYGGHRLSLLYKGNTHDGGQEGYGGPVLSDFIPVPDSSVTVTNTTISLKATDPQNVDQASAKVTVNGMVIPCTVTYEEVGHWKTSYDSCTGESITYWVHEGWDYTKATITAATSNLPAQNDVLVSVSDRRGNITTHNWQFTVTQ